VVGVVHDMALHITEPVREPTVYTSYLQQADQYRGPNANMFGQMTFVLRGRGDPMSLLPAVQRAVAEVEPNRAISGAMAIVWWGGFVLIDHGLYALVLGTFAAVAILLAAMGIYGVVAYTISQRTREIAIRIALGAGRGEIYAMLCKRGLVLISLGVVAGLIGAAATTRILSAQLWRVTPYDPAVFLGAAIVLTLVGIAATLAPVRRATKIDPAGVLRGA
jgi:predicted lysophospholipase L1 biosynthesis ABC-type transport system permease subunit